MTKNKLKIVCLQTTSSKDPQKNISMLEKLFEKVSSNVDLICLPECVAIFLNKHRESFFNLITFYAKKKKVQF